MATVPRSPDSFTVAPTSLPGSRLTVPEYQDFGSAQMQRTGQALTAAGGAAQKAALEAADEANKLRINSAMNELVSERMRLTYDKDQGFVSVKGEKALNFSPEKSLDQEYSERFQKRMDQIAESLGNEYQRKMFLVAAGEQFNRFSGSIKEHISREFLRAKEQNYERTFQTAYQLAVNEGTDPNLSPEMRSEALQKASDVIRNNISGNTSFDEKGRAAELTARMSPMHSAVVSAYLEQNNMLIHFQT